MIESTGANGSDVTEGADGVAGQAATWLAQHRLGTIDETAFAHWRAAHPLHGLAFCRALAAWERAGRDEISESALAQAERQMSGAESGSNASRRGLLRAAGIAAAVVVTGTGTLATRAYAWSTAETVVGENRMVALPGGSVAWLNTDSRLSWRFSGAQGALRVERGEVALNIVPGPQVVIHGDDRTLGVTTGRFNARLRSDALDLLVLQGKAWVWEKHGDDNAKAAVFAGQSLLVSPRDAVARNVGPAQLASAIAWQQGEILFQDMTLGMAVEEYNRFLDHKIVIVDRELAGIPVGGRFTSTDPTAFLHALSAGLQVRVARSNSAYLLTR